jgi:hypothetical protein
LEHNFFDVGVGAMAAEVVQSLHANERLRSAAMKPAAPLEAVESVAAKLDRSAKAPADRASRSGSAEQSSPEPPKRPYPAPAQIPTQVGPKGLRFDFNDGCRVLLPEGEHPWRARMSDLGTGNILFETECTRLITAEHIKAAIKTIPGFGTHGEGRA